MLCILLASVSADRYFLAPQAWAPAAPPVSTAALPQTWPAAEAGAEPPQVFFPRWAAPLDLPRAAVEMRNRLNLKKEKRKRNYMNALRFKKPEQRRWNNRGGPGNSDYMNHYTDADKDWMGQVFTESDAVAAAAAQGKQVQEFAVR